MELYYKNETLFVDVQETISESIAKTMKKRIFSIVDDYGIDHIILQTNQVSGSEKKLLLSIEKDYKEKYNGKIVIK